MPTFPTPIMKHASCPAYLYCTPPPYHHNDPSNNTIAMRKINKCLKADRARADHEARRMRATQQLMPRSCKNDKPSTFLPCHPHFTRKLHYACCACPCLSANSALTSVTYCSPSRRGIRYINSLSVGSLIQPSMGIALSSKNYDY